MSEKNKNCEGCADKKLSETLQEFLEEPILLLETDPSEYAGNENTRDYASAKKQIETMQTITFGFKIHVLLMTTRLQGCANGLQEYLQNSTDITVDSVNTLEEAEQVIRHKPIDFFIIVGGMFKNWGNYAAIEKVKRINKYATVIMYAALDAEIKGECRTYKINHAFNRYCPMESFISYMRKCYEDETIRLQRDFTSETERAQIWMDVMQSTETELNEQESADLERDQPNGIFNKILYWFKTK